MNSRSRANNKNTEFLEILDPLQFKNEAIVEKTTSFFVESKYYFSFEIFFF